jgi:formate/nitrite transporter FocA (FNT family)
MFLFPSGLIMGSQYSLMDYFIWNEIPTVLGNLIGGITFTGLPLYATHIKTAAKRRFTPEAEPAAHEVAVRA